jgi:hypothetical protein
VVSEISPMGWAGLQTRLGETKVGQWRTKQLSTMNRKAETAAFIVIAARILGS